MVKEVNGKPLAAQPQRAKPQAVHWNNALTTCSARLVSAVRRYHESPYAPSLTR
jgi:hypothetical protein